MRLLFVVQRYGHEIAGGAETFCREFATRLTRRGHDVTVVTSQARSYVDWANELPGGTSTIDGVTVHRLPVLHPRPDDAFGPLNARVLHSRMVPSHLQESWMKMQGPLLTTLPAWLTEHGSGFDAIVFYTYLYYSTWAGLPVASAMAPTILHPTAHDEPPLYLAIFEEVFRLPHAFGFLTEEERALVDRRFHVHQPFAVTGIGIEPAPAGDEARFRRTYGVDDPYLLSVGRLDPHKGSEELFDFFTAYKERNPGDLKLVVVGEPVRPLPPHPDVVVTGFVDDATKQDAFAGAMTFVHASYFESFSLVLAEAWSHGLPALVQGHSDVLAGQARRSGGGIPYAGFGEFEAAVDLLTSDAALRRRLGTAGRNYVEHRYDWDHVLGSYERFVAEVVASDPARQTRRRWRPVEVAAGGSAASPA